MMFLGSTYVFFLWSSIDPSWWEELLSFALGSSLEPFCRLIAFRFWRIAGVVGKGVVRGSNKNWSPFSGSLLFAFEWVLLEPDWPVHKVHCCSEGCTWSLFLGAAWRCCSETCSYPSEACCGEKRGGWLALHLHESWLCWCLLNAV